MAYIVSTSSAEGGPASSLNITKPSGLADDDILIVFFGSGGGQSGDVTINAPSGFITVLRTSTSSDIDRQIWCFRKTITDASSEPSSYNFSFATSVPIQAHMYAIREANTSDIINNSSGAISNSSIDGNNVIAPNVTTDEDDCLVLSCVMACGVGGIPTNFTPPASVTEEIDNGEVVWNILGTDRFVYQASGYFNQATAGSTGSKTWTITLGIGVGIDTITMTVAINDYIPTCTCDSVCDNDCSSNQLCTGNESACTNEFTFTNTPSIGDLIRSIDLTELQTAINNERIDATRRYTASDPTYCTTHTPGDVACTSNDFSSYTFTAGVSAGEIILVDHYDDIKDANNEVVNDSGYGSLVTTNFVKQSDDPVNSVIYAADIVDLQTKINETRNSCICDSHCNCDPSDCGCDAECPSHDGA